MAKNGHDGAQASLEISRAHRLRRDERTVNLVRQLHPDGQPLAAAAGATGTAQRKVYDCGHGTALHVPTRLVRSEGGAVVVDPIVNQVYDFAGNTRDYLKTLGRNSIDNNGMDLVLNVHYGTNFMNAFWDGDEMVFGDGDNQVFTSFGKSADVVAHELFHGVTQFTANLVYKGQPGALNEHFSDVFGSVVQQIIKKQNAGNADWLIGDEIMGPTLRGEALRSMKYPGTAYDNNLMGKDPQPAHMDQYYAGPNDNYGVHINSGIMNRVFYLVAMDIGTTAAAGIWFETLGKLWSTAKFNDAVAVLVRVARNQVAQGKVPLGSPQSVRAALKSVGLPR
ncbi:MAG: peptidase M4 family protein [Magnetococcales bacterium]|nr:peptidase M4 family protein [Magnetococcales bacterium]